jgi:hypothetical protein
MVEILVLGGQAPEVTAPSRDKLLHKLDSLLERYLNLLDRYQQARLQLSNHLSSVGGLHPASFLYSKATDKWLPAVGLSFSCSS